MPDAVPCPATNIWQHESMIISMMSRANRAIWIDSLTRRSCCRASCHCILRKRHTKSLRMEHALWRLHPEHSHQISDLPLRHFLHVHTHHSGHEGGGPESSGWLTPPQSAGPGGPSCRSAWPGVTRLPQTGAPAAGLPRPAPACLPAADRCQLAEPWDHHCAVVLVSAAGQQRRWQVAETLWCGT